MKENRDERLEQDLFRENLKVCPVILRVWAYFIDMLLMIVVLSLCISSEQQDKVTRAYEMLINLSHVVEKSLDSNTNNSQVLENVRVSAKEALEVILIYVVVCALLNILYNFILLYYYGASLGQILMKIKVVDIYNFDKPSLHKCMKRSILKYILGTSLLIGFIPAFADRFSRTIYDRMSKTIVISN